MKLKFFLLLSLLVILAACDGKKQSENYDEKYVVEYEGRKVNLEPYFKGFPYSNFLAIYAADKIFYYHQDSTTTLEYTSLQKLFY